MIEDQLKITHDLDSETLEDLHVYIYIYRMPGRDERQQESVRWFAHPL